MKNYASILFLMSLVVSACSNGDNPITDPDELEEALQFDGINFGEDLSSFSQDGECDDPRFDGPAMTSTPLNSSDILRDATDCLNGYKAKALRLRDF